MQTKGYGLTVIALGATSLALMSGGTAFAYWTTAGAGTGSAAATTSQPLVLASPVAVSGLYPTGTVTGGSVRVTNPNPFKVQLSGATFTGPVTSTKPGCTASTVTLSVSAPATVVAAGGSVDLTVTAAMSNAAEDACQGAVFTQPLVVSAQSAA